MRRLDLFLVLPIALSSLFALDMSQDQKRPGYDDTPQLPGSPWRVHDNTRPYPHVVTPGQDSSAPSDAIVLFDGSAKSLRQNWTGRDDKASWELVEGGAMRVNRSGNIRTRAEFGDCQLHVEWRSPHPAKGSSQGRGNSGVFLMGRYEVQVLDSFENPSYPDGQAAALYGQTPPLVNACRRPGEWQSYDILFTAPRFDGDGKLVSPAYATVLHNGVCVHHHRVLLGPTSHKRLPGYREHPPQGPIHLQDHGDPVEYRNIWVRALLGYDRPAKDGLGR
jgi:hypothetical protein